MALPSWVKFAAPTRLGRLTAAPPAAATPDYMGRPDTTVDGPSMDD
jgi:hypothetical protein